MRVGSLEWGFGDDSELREARGSGFRGLSGVSGVVRSSVRLRETRNSVGLGYEASVVVRSFVRLRDTRGGGVESGCEWWSVAIRSFGRFELVVRSIRVASRASDLIRELCEASGN